VAQLERGGDTVPRLLAKLSVMVSVGFSGVPAAGS